MLDGSIITVSGEHRKDFGQLSRVAVVDRMGQFPSYYQTILTLLLVNNSQYISSWQLTITDAEIRYIIQSHDSL